MEQPKATRPLRPRTRFGLLFLFFLSILALIFEYGQQLLGRIYTYPVSAAAKLLLDFTGIQARLDTSQLSLGFCDLAVGNTVCRVIPECTGIFVLFILLAAILAYPTALIHKGWGVLLGIPAFFLYSALRLAILGTVVWLNPEWLKFMHMYLMVVLNLGFALFLWIYWTHNIYADRQ